MYLNHDKLSFSTYELIDDGDVLMGNNVAYRTLGIRTIKIKIHDGIIRTLAEVRHVPDLKKNLISSGTFDAKGCKYASGGVLKICKGFFVLMKGLKVGSLYMLECSTVTIIVVCSLVTADDTSRLWYMRVKKAWMLSLAWSEYWKVGIM